MRKNNKNINKNSFILESMMTFATLSLFGVGFSAWVYTGGGGTQQEVGNFEVSVGDLNTIISLEGYSIFETATIGSEKYFYNPSTGVFSDTGTLTVYLIYHSALMTTSTSTIKGVLSMNNAIPNGTTLSGTPGIYNEDFLVNSSEGNASFTLGFNNDDTEDQDFSLSFTFTNALLNLPVSPVFYLEFEVTQEVTQ